MDGLAGLIRLPYQNTRAFVKGWVILHDDSIPKSIHHFARGQLIRRQLFVAVLRNAHFSATHQRQYFIKRCTHGHRLP